METTKLSSKGQVVLPKATRQKRRWETGIEFQVVETDEGVLLKPLRPFPPTTVGDVFGMARYKGPKRSLADMDEAVRAEAARRK